MTVISPVSRYVASDSCMSPAQARGRYGQILLSPQRGFNAEEDGHDSDINDNRYCDYNINDFTLTWELLENGNIIKQGCEKELPHIAPKATGSVSLPIEYSDLADNKEYHLNVHLTLKKAENWADAGHIVAEEQFALHTPVMATETITPQGGEPLKVTDESRQRVNIFNNNIKLTFNKLTAQLISMQFSGNEMLHMQQGPRFYGYRSISNEVREWIEPKYEVKDFTYETQPDGSVFVQHHNII